MKPSNVLKFFIGLYFLSLTSAVFAGGWASGGGQLLKDARNPWFLNHNKSEVSYCVRIQEDNMGVTRQRVDEVIHSAWEYWLDQIGTGGYSIGNQTLKLYDGNCRHDNAAVDLVFQFGILEDDQREFLKFPQNYGAISIRTRYEFATAQGGGFVYVSPQAGPDRLDMPGVAPDVWEQNSNKTLKLVLMHELGHVFGLAHFGSTHGVMNERFVETALTRPELWSDRPLPDVLQVQNVQLLDFCQFASDHAKFFGLTNTAHTGCFRFYIKPRLVEVYVQTVGGGWEFIGQAVHDQVAGYADLESYFKFFSPGDQVSAHLPYQGFERLYGKYVGVNGTERLIVTYFHPERPEISALMDGYWIPDLQQPFPRRIQE